MFLCEIEIVMDEMYPRPLLAAYSPKLATATVSVVILPSVALE